MTAGRFDVLVAGAGPSGAVTAALLAGRGLRTLLVGESEAPGPGHDLALSAAALGRLRTLGLLDGDPGRPDGAVDVRFGSGDRRAFAGTRVTFADRDELRTRLGEAATARGAVRLPGRVVALTEHEAGHEATVETADGTETFVVRHAVVAVGSGTDGGLLPSRSPHGAGVAVARRYTGTGGESRMLIQFRPPSEHDPHDRPAGVWVLPGADGACTVGVVAIGADAGATALLGTALAELAEAEPRFAQARPLGPATAGRVETGFTPGLAVHRSRLLVGDAAGLVNPFTGEGLTHAFHSAQLAADAITAHPEDPGEACLSYQAALGRAFVGYFETARHAARRYHLGWRMLAATTHSDQPLFTLARRAVLLAEGPHAPQSVRPDRTLNREDRLYLRPFTAAADEMALAAVRDEWPFLARMLTAEGAGALPLRPVTLFAAALAASGAPPDPGRAAVGAAMDLAALGALALLSPPGGRAGPARGVDWETTITVLACDFLLAQAARLVADHAPEVSWAFSDWLAELTALRATRLTDPGTGAAGDVFASLWEFPARVGAQLGGADDATVERVRDFGHHCGHAFVLAEEVMALAGRRTRLDTTVPAMLAARTSALPRLLGRPGLDAAGLDDALRHEARDAVAAACTRHLEAALDAARDVPSARSSRLLGAHARDIADSAGLTV
ncbi:FAD-dependent monooxygenase [Spirillospora sp. CA-294931]|uniref:FAD-dependent monooxygenase n=1 Tax=Spirillospora sp. CA-294931 TaxID=3240042 RepID=UPI003D931E48